MKKEACIDKRNQDLYEKVRGYYKVNFKKSTDDSWSSQIINDVVIICHSLTDNPISAFTHELLHIDTQLSGYKKIRAGLSLNSTTRENLIRLIENVDNEFQHHKMYDKFISMGFSSNEFYKDSDKKEVIPYLKGVLNTPSQPFISLAVDYLTLIAPGGNISSDKFAELKRAFYNYDGQKYLAKFHIIEQIISGWKADSNYDAETYIVDFFRNLGTGETWITYSDDEDLTTLNFPSAGFFTEEPFTIEEISKEYK